MSDQHHIPSLTLATRGSLLALWQANFVANQLNTKNIKTQLMIVKTSGDRIQDRMLHEIGGKGVFVREIESALIDKSADIAVHSLKDLPVNTPQELSLRAFLKRHDPGDVLIFRHDFVLPNSWNNISTLTKSHLTELSLCRIGSGSLRRRTLILEANPILEVIPIRGNIDTRLRKLEEGEWDAIILAKAALDRSKLGDQFKCYVFDTRWFIPSAGQGVIVVETRRKDKLTSCVEELDCPVTRFAICIERDVLKKLGGDCTLPVGVFANLEHSNIWRVRAMVGCEGDNISCEITSKEADPLKIADLVIAQLKNLEVNRILQKLKLPGI